MEREAFLDRLRSCLASPAPPHRPVADIAEPPAIRYAVDLGDPVAAFTERAGVAGALVRPADDLTGFFREVVDEVAPRRAVVTRGTELDAAAASLTGLGVDVASFDAPDPDADLGVVGAAWGIAATGTVVFDSGGAGGRSASLLPPAICVLLPTDRILPDVAAVFGRVAADPPSQLVLCTGPSKTGDIEQQLITGVHGPGRVWVGLVRL